MILLLIVFGYKEPPELLRRCYSESLLGRLKLYLWQPARSGTVETIQVTVHLSPRTVTRMEKNKIFPCPPQGENCVAWYATTGIKFNDVFYPIYKEWRDLTREQIQEGGEARAILCLKGEAFKDFYRNEQPSPEDAPPEEITFRLEDYDILERKNDATFRTRPNNKPTIENFISRGTYMGARMMAKYAELKESENDNKEVIEWLFKEVINPVYADFVKRGSNII